MNQYFCKWVLISDADHINMPVAFYKTFIKKWIVFRAQWTHVRCTLVIVCLLFPVTIGHTSTRHECPAWFFVCSICMIRTDLMARQFYSFVSFGLTDTICCIVCCITVPLNLELFISDGFLIYYYGCKMWIFMYLR